MVKRKVQGSLEAVLAIAFFSLSWSFFFTVSKAATVLSGKSMYVYDSSVPKEGTPREGGKEEKIKEEKGNFPSF